jgi:NADH-quinone oxidoreductase subunit L
MVAAGVFMMVRMDFLVLASVDAATVIAWIGGITALMAALMATQQNDIKRVLAYSTLSQLGYMVMAVGLNAGLAGYFHLFTHAGFKALLFLGSGAVIYACHHEQDIWKMGGLKDKMKLTTLTFAIGTAALIAIPGTSGFFSKEAILDAAKEHSLGLFAIGAFVAFLTSFYMTRLFVVAFLGKPRDHGAEHAHEAPMVMLLPLLILCVPSLLAGYGFFHGSILPHPAEAGEHPGLLEMMLHPVGLTSLVALLAGVGLGFMVYRGKDADPLKISLFANKFYFDELYTKIVNIAQDRLATAANFFDKLFIDGLAVRGSALTASGAGQLFRKLQVGNIQGYAFLFGLGVLLLIFLAIMG